MAGEAQVVLARGDSEVVATIKIVKEPKILERQYVLADGAVDHVLPRQVINHDEVWNLVLAHSHCNSLKSDLLIGTHFIEKLIKRNENIMGSNHPWRGKIQAQLGNTPAKRSSSLLRHYENVKTVRGSSFWGGVPTYNPETDPFYRKLITKLNGG
jgi:hypothetical protein